MADTHTVMPKKLAQALMEAGMQHFDAGGLIGALGVGNNFQADSAGDIAKQSGQQYGQQQDVYGQQQALASQLLAQTQGQGPGQQLIAQQQGQNAAQQGALMGSVRGASANPALIARQAAMAGAQGQQQSLNAQSALQLQSQGALQQQQSQMANQSLQSQSILQGALASQNQVNAQVAGQNAGANQSLLGGVLGGLTGGLLSHGGEVPKNMAVGGQVPLMGMQNFQTPSLGLQPGQLAPKKGPGKGLLTGLFGGDSEGPSSVGQAGPWELGGGMAGGPMDAGSLAPSGGPFQMAESLGPLMMAAAHGGKIPFGQMLAGGNVPGQAQVKGDSAKNDTVPTMLSPGEVVLPRSVAQAPDAPRKAAEFMAHLKKKKKGGYGAVAEAKRRKTK